MVILMAQIILSLKRELVVPIWEMHSKKNSRLKEQINLETKTLHN
jgi:hypothetical protein